MSRIGKTPVAIPKDVTVTVSGRNVSVKGPKGELAWDFPAGITVTINTEAKQVQVGRTSDSREAKALHGLTRALVNNMVSGVVKPFEKKLEIQGVGYQASLSGKTLNLNVGFSHAVKLEVPNGVSCVCTSQTQVVLQSCDRHAVGQFAANIRAVRPPDPYKGKGIRYHGEFVRRKAGKAFGSK